MTCARSVERLTVAVTPSSLFSLVCTRTAHAAQVIPPMTSSTWVVPGATSVSGLAAATSTTPQHLPQSYGNGTPAALGRPRYRATRLWLRSYDVGMSLSVITVTGMTCEHCEKAVRAEISAIPGVSQVDVDVASGEVRILAEPAPERAALQAAVEEAGYQLAALR